ncbi:hypothetical protein E7Z59_03020 [Robertkochia marina]|uniref:DUF4175 family protein n=1 Tax=Robertkochia marina TaxID=1227945 RepID=A0A4S3M3J4_9FLAO|nr:DUF4175 family protein [Robertkochia marina]THD69315.1 hypothetical protein E7Z59_03020 [Robertkochia marina]TRZ47425.1 hypothetical protein D3A96_01565 [Robertkochia marina]
MESQIGLIKKKLSGFLKKYYTNMLIRGVLLFTAIGGCYFLFSVGVEYFLWLSPNVRTVLFWLFVAVESVLFYRFVITPLLYLFKIKQGLTEKTASKLIGKHFKEVDDKLLNLLQLAQQPEKSELLLAGIEKRSRELSHIPFNKAINFSTNTKYLKFLSIPLILILLVWLSGKALSFKDSYKRMVDYTTVYTPPAPFSFKILNDSLTALSGVPFLLKVSTEGTLAPAAVQIKNRGAFNYMQPDGNGNFEYLIDPGQEELSFHLTSNDVSNGPYTLKVLPVPAMLNFKMTLDYPEYTGRRDESLNNTGNATVPEGSRIGWEVETNNTTRVELLLKDSVIPFEGTEDQFKLYQTVFKSLSYELATGNDILKQFEKIGFNLRVIKDQYPKITTGRELIEQDAASGNIITGEISDDYGFKKLELVYYPEEDPDTKKRVLLSNPKGNIDRFRFNFPGNLSLKEGVNYLYYFSVTDNDALRNGKQAKSEVYSYYKLRENELKAKQLEQQKEQIQKLGNTLKQIDEQESELQELKNVNKQKDNLSYNDKRKLNNFLKRQEQQEEMMKSFSKNMEQNLEEFSKNQKADDPYNDLLKERLERQQQEIERNQKLLKELQEYTEKIDKETLTQKLEELAKNQQSNKRSLEQLLELTKRYYVQAKAENIRKDLEELSKQQDTLSTKSETGEAAKQEELNKAFKEIQNKMEDLTKENDALKKPMELGRNKSEEENVNQEQKEALEKLNEEESPKGSENQNQKKASRNIRKIVQNMQSSMSMEGAEMISEDAAMLRQILENLIKFSFDQEDIMEELNRFDQNNPNLPYYLKKQNDLKILFEHVDDSLFALSLRRPEVSEVVNTNITEVYYNVDKSLERFADNQYFQGITHQQYTLTAANNLSDFLSDLLDQMQNMMMGSGKGNQDSFQLPDIIQSQEQLNQQMQDMLSKPKPGDSDQEQNGQDGKEQQGEGKQEDKEGYGEGMSEQLYEIYKQQQLLKESLLQQLRQMQNEQQLEDVQNKESAKQKTEALVRQMERIERDLLNKGINEQTLKQMQYLKHQLLKLEQAEQLQGEKNERESTTNRKEFTQNTSNQSSEVQDSFQELEILQRQVLPLREIYKLKVQRYFKVND